MATNYKALYDGELEIGEGYKIFSAVLDDENKTRVLSQNEIVKALGRSAGGSKRGEANLPRWISAGNLTPFIPDDLREAIINPIIYKTTSGNTAHGIEATKLIDICEVWLNLERSGQIHESQKDTAKRAYILTIALAKTSIIALVDEATGYQEAKERTKDTLQKFLKKAIQEEAAKWIKTFQDEFFEVIYIMKGWNWGQTNKNPSVVGHYINDFVYSRIAPQVLQELRNLNPKNESGNRKNKHHQHLSRDFGHPLLKEHIAGIIALAKASGYNWDTFLNMVDRVYPKYGQVAHLNFPEEYDEPKNKLSNFDQKLKKGLDFNPKDEE